MKQRGSSLLIILLIMTGVASVVMVGTKALIDSSRATTAGVNSAIASQMARSGIQDGLLLYNGGFLQDGEYGGGNYTATQLATSPNYSNWSVRRGFTDSACTVWSTDESTQSPSGKINMDCPYYEMTVRTIISRSDTEGNSKIPIHLTSRELPDGTATVIPVKQQTGGVALTVDSIPGYTFDYAVCTVNYACTGETLTTVTNQSGNVNLTNPPGKTIKGIQFTSHFPAGLVGSHFEIINSIDPISGYNGGANPVAVGKGYTTIDVVGYSGGVRKGLVMAIRQNDRVQLQSPLINPHYILLDFADSFTNGGALYPCYYTTLSCLSSH